jgi:hypothetical protein
MNRFHGLRVALMCACALVAGCQGGDGGGASSETPTAAVAPPSDSTGGNPPPTGNAGITSVTVSWVAPLENVDGTALTDLAGFVIVYGTSSDALSQSVYIDNPSIDRYLLEDLSAGTWYFGVKAYSASGAESDLSPLVSKTLN